MRQVPRSGLVAIACAREKSPTLPQARLRESRRRHPDERLRGLHDRTGPSGHRGAARGLRPVRQACGVLHRPARLAGDSPGHRIRARSAIGRRPHRPGRRRAPMERGRRAAPPRRRTGWNRPAASDERGHQRWRRRARRSARRAYATPAGAGARADHAGRARDGPGGGRRRARELGRGERNEARLQPRRTAGNARLASPPFDDPVDPVDLLSAGADDSRPGPSSRPRQARPR